MLIRENHEHLYPRNIPAIRYLPHDACVTLVIGASPFLVFNVAILSVCLSVCMYRPSVTICFWDSWPFTNFYALLRMGTTLSKLELEKTQCRDSWHACSVSSRIRIVLEIGSSVGDKPDTDQKTVIIRWAMGPSEPWGERSESLPS